MVRNGLETVTLTPGIDRAGALLSASAESVERDFTGKRCQNWRIPLRACYARLASLALFLWKECGRAFVGKLLRENRRINHQ
jgi:hypothetical protein